MELDKHRLRAMNMRESRWHFHFVGAVGFVGGLLVVVSAVAGDLGTDAVVAGVVMAVC